MAALNVSPRRVKDENHFVNVSGSSLYFLHDGLIICAAKGFIQGHAVTVQGPYYVNHQG